MLLNPFENYTPPAVEDILSDHPSFRHSVLALKQQAIMRENSRIIIESSPEQIDLFLGGGDGLEYSRPVQDLQHFGQFATPDNLVNFVTQSVILGIATGINARGLQLDREADITPEYDDESPDSIPTVTVKIQFTGD